MPLDYAFVRDCGAHGWRYGIAVFFAKPGDGGPVALMLGPTFAPDRQSAEEEMRCTAYSIGAKFLGRWREHDIDGAPGAIARIAPRVADDPDAPPDIDPAPEGEADAE